MIKPADVSEFILIRRARFPVRCYRKKLGLSQEKLGELAALHRTHIADIERGARNVSILNITRIARALGIDVSELCGGLQGDFEELGPPQASQFHRQFGFKGNDDGVNHLGIDIRFKRKGFLAIQTRGAIDERTLSSLYTATSSVAQKYRCKRFFLDHRESVLRLNTGDINNIPTKLQRHGIVGQRAALVFANVGENEKFLEKICAKQQVLARVFHNPDGALAWLR